MILLGICVSCLFMNAVLNAVLISRIRDDLKIASANFATLDRRLTQETHNRYTQCNKLYSDLTDFLMSNTKRSAELDAKIDQLEEDFVVALLAKKE